MAAPQYDNVPSLNKQELLDSCKEDTMLQFITTTQVTQASTTDMHSDKREEMIDLTDQLHCGPERLILGPSDTAPLLEPKQTYRKDGEEIDQKEVGYLLYDKYL